MASQYRLSWALTVAIVIFYPSDDLGRRGTFAVAVDVDNVESHQNIYVQPQVPESRPTLMGQSESNQDGEVEQKQTKDGPGNNNQCYRNAQTNEDSCGHLSADVRPAHSHSKQTLRDVQYKIKEKGTAEQSMLQNGIDGVVNQVLRSKIKAMEELEYIMEQVSSSRARVMEELDSMMGRVSDSVSESRHQVLDSFDALKEKVAESRRSVMRSLDDVIDTVARGQLQEELQGILDQVAHSQVMQDIQALPQGIRNSLLSVRNRSYVVSGIAMAITAAVLLVGVVYCYWCTNDSWSWAYHMQPLHLPDHDQDTSKPDEEIQSETTPLKGEKENAKDTLVAGEINFSEKPTINNNSSRQSSVLKLKSKLVIAKCSKQHLGSHSYIESCESNREDAPLSPDDENNQRESDSGFVDQPPGFSDHTGSASVARADGSVPAHEELELPRGLQDACILPT